MHWGIDGWQHVQDTQTRDTTLGVYVADLPTTASPGRLPSEAQPLQQSLARCTLFS